jgi:hypothetical protein
MADAGVVLIVGLFDGHLSVLRFRTMAASAGAGGKALGLPLSGSEMRTE